MNLFPLVVLSFGIEIKSIHFVKSTRHQMQTKQNVTQPRAYIGIIKLKLVSKWEHMAPNFAQINVWCRIVYQI